MKKMIAIAAAGIFALPALASAQIVGQCADCHTMHNSEQGQRVAVAGLGGAYKTTGNEAIQNLLRMDCIACHAQKIDGPKIAILDGGSRVPQVFHGDATGDLAAGNFKHLDEGGNRKGHNVVDLFTMDSQNQRNAPGDIRNFNGGHDFANFTCAGAKGCHGTRSQAMGEGVLDPGTGLYAPGTRAERTGIAAISGAHHISFDGAKDPAQIPAGPYTHSGEYLANSYRFLAGLKGYGNEDDRWQNLSSTSHNEYYGSTAPIVADGCNRCHVPGTATGIGLNARFTTDSTLRIPNQSMSGFCSTCHGNFHSSGNTGSDFVGVNTPTPAGVAAGLINPGIGNGTSGAFLRHPSDYAIPNRGEYANYTAYSITAPVARTSVFTEASGEVTPGTDLVMCLSCHVAHASEHDGMLRFDYGAMIAGSAEAGTGCLACHTLKGAR